MTELLNPRLVREHIAQLAMPADIARRREVMRGWTAALRRGELTDANEVQLHGEFLTRVFGDVLGYRMRTTAGESGAYELRAEQGLTGRSVDGAVGFFNGDQQHIVAPIELKGASQALDTRKGRAQTPVQQAWEYASRAPESQWIVVSNYDETRLYSKARGWDAYELFKLEDLDKEDGFLRFYALLSRDVLLGTEPGSRSALNGLLEASAQRQQQITKELYETYRDIRRDLFEDLCRRNSNQPPLDLLPHAQTILDRVIFCAFAEDRLLIPQGTIARALDSKNPHDGDWTNWKALAGVFRGVDVGNAILGLPPLNGGLFKKNVEIDELDVSADLCERFRNIAAFDFADDVSVTVLGHIFEQSVSDLEELRVAAEQRVEHQGGTASQAVVVDTQRRPSKRRAEGVFYTPSFVTRYLTDLTLGEAFREREAAAFAAVYLPTVRRSKDRDLEAWERYRESLRSLRVLDPACGSGAFLIAAFEALEREYDRVNRALARLRDGQIEVFDLTTSVLNENLFGVDLNGESVEITKLSLWLKTARKDRQLTYLDGNIRRGNSVVGDALLDPWAFDWNAGRTARNLAPTEPADPRAAAAIDARWREGFDVVLGNPPYVRQELLTRYKEHWSQSYACYDGVADLFIYFFERGLSVLKAGGRLGFIVSNKWLKAGYAEKLRGYLARTTAIERLVDFGHAPIFPDADAFPVVVSIRKLGEAETPEQDHAIAVTQFPREQLNKVEVPSYVAEHTTPLAQAKLSTAAWSLATGEEDVLFEKIRTQRAPLREYAGCKPYRGVLTGLNEAFVVDTATRDHLVRADARTAEIIRPFLRGQDIARWVPEWAGLWMLFARRGIDIDAYPAVRQHLLGFRARLEPRPANYVGNDWKGRKPGSYKWYEIQDSIDYHAEFAKPKIIYQEIQFHPSYALDADGRLLNNKGFMLPTESAWLIAVLNSPLMWWFNWRYLPHMKDEALSPVGELMATLPIAAPSSQQQDAVAPLVARLHSTVAGENAQRAAVLDLLRMQHGIDKPGNALTDMQNLSSDSFVAEVLKRRPKPPRGRGSNAARGLSVAGQRELRQLFEQEIVPMRQAAVAKLADERALSKLVNAAYGLTAKDEALLWATAPPRMPSAR